MLALRWWPRSWPMLVATLCLLLVAGRQQSISFVRYSSFMLPLMIAVSIVAWQMITIATIGVPRIRWLFAFVLPAALLVAAVDGTEQSYREGLARVLINATKFARGSFSIYDGYIHQRDWGVPYPNDGAVRPWALAIWKEIGPGTRFWTFADPHLLHAAALSGAAILLDADVAALDRYFPGGRAASARHFPGGSPQLFPHRDGRRFGRSAGLLRACFRRSASATIWASSGPMARISC